MSNVNQRLASLHEARDTFFKALKVHEHAIYQIGYDDGYAAGWEAALNRLAEIKPEAHHKPSGPTDLGRLLHDQAEVAPTHDTLLSVLTKNPGLRRHEIVEKVRKVLPNLDERGVRTALQRMKNAGELQVLEAKWYLSDKQQKLAKAETQSEE